MQINEDEINALLEEADQAGDSDDGATPESSGEPQSAIKEIKTPQSGRARAAQAMTPAELPDFANAAPNVKRLLQLRVPVIVQLAHRRLPISKIRNYSSGSIIEFAKSVDAPMELLIRNEPIGTGEAVRVNEKFGIHITTVKSRTQRIKSLGE